MRIAPLALLVSGALWLAFTPACSGSKTCTTSADCNSDESCSFSPGCSGASGTCMALKPACTAPPTVACTCDGQTLEVPCDAPGPDVPVKSAGNCATPSGMKCNSNEDCDPTALCAFPIAGGCGAQGVCVVPDHTCMDPVPQTLACGCDGQTIAINCMYGSGNAAGPVASVGSPCVVGDGGSTTEAGGDGATE